MDSTYLEIRRRDGLRSVSRARLGGFTLVEMLITVVVLAVLVALAVPNMQDALRKRRVIAAGEAIYGQVQFARSEAIKSSQNVSVVVTTASPWSVAVGGNATVTAGNYPGVSIAAAPATTLTFDGVRGLRSAPAVGAGNETITLTLGAYQLAVEVGVVGRVKLCTPAGATAVGRYPAC
ncbi:GspH/FimT family pseudopilin [Zoogloea sp.]|uniref:GspH/FimT family pseudopilin n=1 Tax=Zoogloea sp. TaxID=49181 RepID=UPI001A60CFA0|nr:GspH/FimT family pseudopilin [Zoogloeaceae bacterium]